jgi:hypothetical protein
MKRVLSVLMLWVLSGTFCLAAPRQAALIPVKATHQRVQRHRAHKAVKHHAPKRHRHHSV